MAGAYNTLPTSHLDKISSTRRRPLARKLLDWPVALLAGWTVGGIYLDGWAHDHGKVDSSFFTVWHGLLYSGFLALTLFLIIALVINHNAGYSWQKALPAGYNLSMVGVLVFGFGGVGDMLWHIILGVEVSTEALLSPTHLALALGITLLASGPLRAAWLRLKITSPGWGELLPALLSFLLVYSMFTFFTQFAHPFLDVAAGTFEAKEFGFIHPTSSDISHGVTSILFQAAVMMGFVLLLIRRWHLPFGTFTLILTLNGALMCIFRDNYQLIPAALITGLVADLGLSRLNRMTKPVAGIRVFAFLVPALLYALYFVELALVGEVSWSVPLWAGSILLAGVAGLSVSYLVYQPRSAVVPDEDLA